MEEETNIISLLEKANKYIIILNKSITERISKLKELYSPYFPELPTIVTNSYEYVQSLIVIKENKSLLTSHTNTILTRFLAASHSKLQPIPKTPHSSLKSHI